MLYVYILFAMIGLVPSTAYSQFVFGGMEPEQLRNRISDLNPPEKGLPENEFSLLDERRAVDSEISEVRSIAHRSIDRTKEIEAIDNAKTAIIAHLADVAKADCKKLPEGVFLPGQKIVEQLSIVERRHFPLDFDDEPNPWRDLSTLQRRESESSDQGLCERWKKAIGDSAKQAGLLAYLGNRKSRLAEQTKRTTEAKTQATILLDLLQKRKDAIEKKLLSQSTKTELTDKLWIVIGVIGTFSIGAILAVKLFSETIQIEWVASGQVIQFVTVMILLSVIMALGLAGILKENTLGTLLGGIAGYVLAQGVGRAAAREVSRERERKQDPLT